MRLCVFLLFICMLLPEVRGLKCFTCWGVNPGTCTKIWDCPKHFDRCSTTIVAENMITKECMKSDVCNNIFADGVRCCSGDLCNGAKPTGVFVPLILAPVAVILLWL